MIVSRVVVLTVVETFGEADAIGRFLLAEGITYFLAKPEEAEEEGPGFEVCIGRDDLERARRLIGPASDGAP